ncbi:unnamed protein product [Lasius platythorax]
MKYYIPPPDFDNVSFDLKNFTSTRSNLPSYIKLDDMLRWISENFNRLKKPLSAQGDQWLDIDFICRRGVLRTLLCTPYKKKDKWIICAAKYRGTIYLCEFYTNERERQHANKTAEEKFGSWGRKFEQYMVADQPSHKPDPSVPLNECAKFHCIFKANFGDHSLLYVAEIDGILSEQCITDTLIGKTFELIELKTMSMEQYNAIGTVGGKYDTIFVEKAISWWSQNYLAKVEKIICGLRKQWEVKAIKEYPTHNLLKLSKPCCNSDKCKMFCKMFLDNVKRIVIKDYSECMYKFYFDGSSDVINYSEIASNDETYHFFQSSFVHKAEYYNSTFQ